MLYTKLRANRYNLFGDSSFGAVTRAGYNQYSLNFYDCTQLLQLSFFAFTIIAVIVLN